jgi:hypothetical protein
MAISPHRIPVRQPVFAELSYRLTGLVSANRGRNVTDALSNR